MSVSPPSILMLGEPGNGKTFSLATIPQHKHIKKFFYLFTDPGGDESLIDGLRHYDVPVDKIHWHYIPPASQGWDTLEELATKVNTMDYNSIANIKAGINKREHRQMFDIIGCLANFKCQRTGEEFGAADDWPDDYSIAFDSLTGLNKIARDSTVGAKPTLHQGEWGIAMSMEENFIRKFVSSIKCPRVMVGHLDKQMDEVVGRMTLQVSLLGNKLAPQIPHMFSDVVYAYRQGEDFLWSTTDDRISLKTRNLPLNGKILPSYGPVLDKWQERAEYSKDIRMISAGDLPMGEQTLLDLKVSLKDAEKDREEMDNDA